MPPPDCDLLYITQWPAAGQNKKWRTSPACLRTPEKAIFVVRENGTTCLMAEFAAKFIVPYDVWASNYVDLITEQAYIPLSRGAEEQGKCGSNEAELQIFWIDKAYTLRLYFVKEGRNTSTGPEAWWKMNKVQFVYDSSERTYFKDAVNPGKHTSTTRHLSALVTPAGKSYECQAQQTITLTSSDHQKSVVLLLSEVRLQPFDISSDFTFSEGKGLAGAGRCLGTIWKDEVAALGQQNRQLPWKAGMDKGHNTSSLLLF
uniref:Lysosome-associated membrane glycoprotein 5 n=1 Tax=Podarcis muralis TaxID=64176 RepID=A0A670HS32_PODMU